MELYEKWTKTDLVKKMVSFFPQEGNMGWHGMVCGMFFKGK
jgi:hypothetical protein